ncbi:methyltransferase domain-containing protein [soil metagenome]
MTLEQFQALLTSTGIAALAAATALSPTEATFLKCFEKLHKRFDSELAKAALETVLLRAKAASRFPDAAVMYFTKEALEQSTSQIVAAHRAQRFAKYKTVLDLACGLGGDAIALAKAGCHVIAFDNDPLRVELATANLKVLGLIGEVRLADVLTEPMPATDAVFCDPARRAEHRRFLSIADYIPSPEDVRRRFPVGTPLAFKLAPGVPWNDLKMLDGEIEFVSLHGELKECVLWLGALKSVKHRASLLPNSDAITAETPEPEPPVGDVCEYLYDPDPAVERAKLVGNLATMLNAESIDNAPAFLTANDLMATPFAESYRVLNTLKYDRKALNATLRELNIGRVTLIRKNTPLNAEEVQHGLKLKGEAHCHVILTRVAGVSSAIVANKI